MTHALRVKGEWNMRKCIALVSLLALVTALGSGCARLETRYGDATQETVIDNTTSWTDMQQMAEAMVDDLLTFPPMVEVTNQRRPVIMVLPIKNNTAEHIDLESLNNTIETRVLRSGKYRFADREKLQDALKEMGLADPSLGIVNPETAAKAGKVIGAEYMLHGTITGDKKYVKQGTVNYYKLTMKLTGVETNIVEWINEKEILKQVGKPKVGF